MEINEDSTIKSSKANIFLISISTPRLEENIEEQRLQKLKQTTTSSPIICVCRFGSNEDAFPDFFDSPLVTAQFIFNETGLIKGQKNEKNIQRLKQKLELL